MKSFYEKGFLHYYSQKDKDVKEAANKGVDMAAYIAIRLFIVAIITILLMYLVC